MKLTQRFDHPGFTGDLTLFTHSAAAHSFASDCHDGVQALIDFHLTALNDDLQHRFTEWKQTQPADKGR